MRLILRIGAFVFGIVGATLLLGVLDEIYPLAWLPLAMGIAVSAIVGCQPWLKAGRLGAPFVTAITSGLSLTYCLSTPPIVTRLGTIASKAVLAGYFAVFALSCALFVVRGLISRKNGAMTGWLLIPIYAALIIGYVSGGIGGGDHMIAWAIRVLHMGRDQAETAVHIFRKSIHISAYGIVGLSLFRGAIAGRTAKPQAVLFAMLIVLCFASFDELRQTTAPNRTGSAWDVALDMTGALIFTLIAAAFVRSQPSKGDGPRPTRKAPKPVQST